MPADLTPEHVLFLMFGVLMVFSSLMMVTSRHPVYSAVYMVVAMFAIAACFVMLDSFFLGVIQVLVYAGAIMVLFLFIIMLLNVDQDGSYVPRAGILEVLLVLVFAGLLGQHVRTAAIARTVANQPYFPSPADVAHIPKLITMQELSNSLFKQHWFSFEAVSLLLLSAILGVVVLSKRRLE